MAVWSLRFRRREISIHVYFRLSFCTIDLTINGVNTTSLPDVCNAMVKMAPPFILTFQLVGAEKALRNIKLFYIQRNLDNIPGRVRKAGRRRNGALLVEVLNEKRQPEDLTLLKMMDVDHWTLVSEQNRIPARYIGRRNTDVSQINFHTRHIDCSIEEICYL